MRLFIAVIISLFIVGCATKPDHIITTEYKYVTYELPTKLTTSCTPTKPMDINAYSKLTPQEREKYLTNYAIMLMGEVKKCDSKVKGITRYVNEVNKIAEENSAKAKHVEVKNGN